MSRGTLRFGDFELIDTLPGASWSCEALAEGTEWGNPQPIEVAVRHLLQDGSIVATQGHDNREVRIRVVLTAADLTALADGEAALFAEIGRVNTLTWDPLIGASVPTVFDVVTSSLEHIMDDLGETRESPERHYSVRFACLPFGRSVDPITLTPTPVTIGTARQKSYTFDVEGSARTEAALHVAGAAALGNTLIYTRPGAPGMIPLRQHQTGGTSVGDGTRVSGAYDSNIETAFEATVPKADLPDGTYIILALLRAASGSGSATITRTTGTQIGSTYIRASSSDSVTAADLTTDYALFQLGPAFQLPSAVVGSEADTEVFVSIADAVGGLTVRLDEAWLVEIETGALTWPGGDLIPPGLPAAEHYWIDPPSVERPYRRLLQGSESDQSDAFGADAHSWGAHVLAPGENYGLLVTDADTTSTLGVEFFPRWFTHATQ